MSKRKLSKVNETVKLMKEFQILRNQFLAICEEISNKNFDLNDQEIFQLKERFKFATGEESPWEIKTYGRTFDDADRKIKNLFYGE